MHFQNILECLSYAWVLEHFVPGVGAMEKQAKLLPLVLASHTGTEVSPGCPRLQTVQHHGQHHCTCGVVASAYFTFLFPISNGMVKTRVRVINFCFLKWITIFKIKCFHICSFVTS